MTDHPYATPDTVEPGEMADNDPHTDKVWCPSCDEDVETVAGTCTACGKEIK